MKQFLFLCFFAVVPAIIFGQSNGKISGKVIDAGTKQPVDYATVSIFRSGSNNPFNGMVTDTKGGFSFKDIPIGEYSLRIDFVGYQRQTVE